MSDFETDLIELLPRLRLFARSRARSWSEADDLVQETCIRCLERRDQYSLGTNLRAWVSMVMRNIHLDSIKKHREEQLNSDAPDPMAADDPHAQLEFSEVHKFIMTLSEEIREVLILAAEGMTSSEMSEILKIPAGTARRRLFDGRMKLSERFNGSVPA